MKAASTRNSAHLAGDVAGVLRGKKDKAGASSAGCPVRPIGVFLLNCRTFSFGMVEGIKRRSDRSGRHRIQAQPLLDDHLGERL